MGIITFFGVIVTLKLSSLIFKACLSKKGGMGVDMGACPGASLRHLVAPLHLVLYSCNTPYIPGRQLIHRLYTITCIVAIIQQHLLFNYDIR